MIMLGQRGSKVTVYLYGDFGLQGVLTAWMGEEPQGACGHTRTPCILGSRDVADGCASFSGNQRGAGVHTPQSPFTPGQRMPG